MSAIELLPSMSTWRSSTRGGLLAIAALLPAAAMADCEIATIEAVDISNSMGTYDWRVPADHVFDVTVRLRIGADEDTCVVDVYALAAPSSFTAPSSSAVLDYGVYAGTSASQSIRIGALPPPGGSSPLRAMTTESDATISLGANIRVAGQRVVPPGGYTTSVTFVAYGSRGGVAQVLSTREVSATLTVDSIATIAIGGITGGRQLIDFGELDSFAISSPATVRVLSNASQYDLILESESGGTLRRDGSPDDWQIDYLVSAFPGFSQLSSPLIIRRNASSSQVPTETDLQFRVEDVSRVRSGTYRDTVTVIVTPVE